jgi:septum site-determining protein MinC
MPYSNRGEKIMIGNTVVFKGTRKGLNIYIDRGADWTSVKSAVLEKVIKGRPFFEGVFVNLTFTGRPLDEAEQKEIIALLEEHMHIGSAEFLGEPEPEEAAEALQASEHFESFTGIEEGMTRFVRGTVRNGQRIFYEGNVVIIGDVNPGGEVIAGGNILVLGTLRGIAHAGATGNKDAVVAAYCLQPTQLRIAGIITRAPEGDNQKPQYPEISYIKQENLIIEPYLPGKAK